MSFVDVEARCTAAVFRHLAGTKAALDNVVVTGIFDNGYTEALDGIAGAEPRFTLPSSSCTRVRAGTSSLRLIDGPFAGKRYRVKVPQPDGTGVTVLPLELQS